KLIPKNALLIVVRSGILKHTLPIAINRKPLTINQDVKALVFNKQYKVSSEYVGYYLKTFQDEILPLIVKHSTTVQSVNSEQFNQLKIPLPPIEIQNQIANVMNLSIINKKQKLCQAEELLHSIDAYILSELGIKLPELKDKACFTIKASEVKNNRIDAYYYQPKFEAIENCIGKGKFQVKALKEFISKIHYGASVKNEYSDSGIPFLRINNLRENEIELAGVIKLPESMRANLGNAFVEEGDLLISRSGTIGLVSVVPKEADGFAFGSFMIKFCLNAQVNKSYVASWLNTKLQKILVQREKIGAIQGNITIPTIENFKIPVPSLSVQQKIADEVKSRMDKAKQLQKEAQEILESAKNKAEEMILGEKR
ncbi:MAG: restriction endonuclease subunit S, partial [Phycisphaerales bacterium]